MNYMDPDIISAQILLPDDKVNLDKIHLISGAIPYRGAGKAHYQLQQNQRDLPEIRPVTARLSGPGIKQNWPP